MQFINFLKKINKKRKDKRKKNKSSENRKFILSSLEKGSEAQNYSIFYNNNNYLSNLCELYGTDKGYINFENPTPYGWKPHTYSIFYNTLFSHCRENVKLLFECGIGTNNSDVESNMSSNGKPGASLRVWRDYFPNAQIIGADIDDRILFNEDRIKTYKVNQRDASSIEKMWTAIDRNNFDIIIDDGLHTLDAGETFFLNSFKKLKKGGVYIIEDVDLNYLYELKNSLKKFDPEVVILKNEYFGQNLIDERNINDNNLIVIRND